MFSGTAIVICPTGVVSLPRQSRPSPLPEHRSSPLCSAHLLLLLSLRGVLSVASWGVGLLAALPATSTSTTSINIARTAFSALAAATVRYGPIREREIPTKPKLVVGFSQAKRKILSDGLVSNAATLLEFSPGTKTDGSSVSLTPNALLPARSSSKRKRSGETSTSTNSSGKEKAVKEREGRTPSIVVCDAASFSTARASEDIAGVLSKYPLKGEGTVVEVVKSDWLSECLRLGSRQPTQPYLLETITPATATKFLKRRTSAAPVEAAPARGGSGGGGESSSSSSKAAPPPSSLSSWGCLARPSTAKARKLSSPKSSSKGNHQQHQGSAGSLGKSVDGVGFGIGGGSAASDGPGDLSKEPVWKDSDGDDGDNGRWEDLMGGSVLRWVPHIKRVSTHIAAFDMDGTLIKTASGKRFGDAEDDWQLWHGKIPTVLRKWHDRGYKLAIISNQMGVGTGKVDKRMLQRKVRSVVKALGVPVEVYLACDDDYYRKPRLGCWDLLSKDHNGGLQVEKEACLYVGDAAGRPKQGTRKKDFSAGDLKLALNAGLPFLTPEQFFMRSTQPLHKNRSLAVLGFDPCSLAGNATISPEALSRPGDGLEVVVLVGPPGGGKSTLCDDRLPNHARVNQDELKTLQKCKRAAEESLKKGVSVVIDATNPAKSTRAGWVALAQQHGATARCIFLTTHKEACFHLNAFRWCNPWSPPEKRRKVPDVVIHSWFKYVEAPQTNEGFSEVIRLPFTLREVGESPEARSEREFLLMHLLSK